MQYTYATSAYHEARFLVHFHLAIRANFERGAILLSILLFQVTPICQKRNILYAELKHSDAFGKHSEIKHSEIKNNNLF